ncbi:MAG TPA: alpha/beta hydrolase [Clostridia bacterium]|nr:alpha/beta hydrolase [Clostridia bacterium]
MEILSREYSYSSTTGVSDIYARSWAPADSSEIKAVFQIAHGMAEHGERYEDFARFLCEHGYAVFINDHVGHGKSVSSQEDYGYFGERDGWIGFVNDAKLLTNIAKDEYPGKPIIFFGHSMGSFVARCYAEKFGAGIAGTIFCGTSGANPAAGIGKMIASFIAKSKGSHYRSEFIDKLAFGGYNKKFNKPRTKFDWLTTDESIVDGYINDDGCGFLFTATGYRDMFGLLQSVSGKSWYSSVPFNLSMLLISGEQDPVGEYGKGVSQVYRDLKRSGHSDVSMILYSDSRHEILNESNKDKVFNDILDWSEKAIEKYNAKVKSA